MVSMRQGEVGMTHMTQDETRHVQKCFSVIISYVTGLPTREPDREVRTTYQ
jgi:hypothetical protein